MQHPSSIGPSLAEAQTMIRRDHPDLRVDVETLEAGSVPALLEWSRHAATVVIGARGVGGFRGMLAGSTAVAHARCPVVVVCGRSTPRIHHATCPLLVVRADAR